MNKITNALLLMGAGACAAAISAAPAQAAPITYAELLSGICIQIDQSPTTQRLSDLQAGTRQAGWTKQQSMAMMFRAVDQVCVTHRGLFNTWRYNPSLVGNYGQVANFPPFNPDWMSYTG